MEDLSDKVEDVRGEAVGQHDSIILRSGELSEETKSGSDDAPARRRARREQPVQRLC